MAKFEMCSKASSMEKETTPIKKNTSKAEIAK